MNNIRFTEIIKQMPMKIFTKTLLQKNKILGKKFPKQPLDAQLQTPSTCFTEVQLQVISMSDSQNTGIELGTKKLGNPNPVATLKI